MNFAPGAFASLLAALNQHGGNDLPRDLVKYLENGSRLSRLSSNLGKKPSAYLRKGAEDDKVEDELDCEREFYDLAFCMFDTDPEATEACFACDEELLEVADVDDDGELAGDYCAQFEDRASEDKEFCAEVKECDATCAALIKPSAAACATEWKEAAACFDVSVELLKEAFTTPCPGLCEKGAVEIN